MGKRLIVRGADFSRFAIGTSTEVVAAPTITISSSGSVTIAGTGTIYYTTDGSTPTTISSVYSSSFNVTSGQTVKAMCVTTAGQSEISEKTYSSGSQVDPGTTETYETPTWVMGYWYYSSETNYAQALNTANGTSPQAAYSNGKFATFEVPYTLSGHTTITVASGYVVRFIACDGTKYLGRGTSTYPSGTYTLSTVVNEISTSSTITHFSVNIENSSDSKFFATSSNLAKINSDGIIRINKS